MKNFKINRLWALALVMLVVLQSCEDEIEYKEIGWQQEASLKISAVDEQRNFVQEANLVTGDKAWAVEIVEFDIEVESDVTNPVVKIDFYLYVQEKNGDDIILHGEGSGKPLVSVSNIPVTGIASMKISASDIIDMFESDFVTERPIGLTADDLFELRWVMTTADGTVLDTRTDCLKCQFGFGIDVIADIWSGTFDYVYISAGEYTVGAGNMVSEGYTGSITVTKVGNGKYEVDDAEFDGSWNGDDVFANLTFDYNSGVVTLSSDHGNTWVYSNFNGSSVDISWTNYWTPYGEWGNLTLTRSDGINWPTNLNSGN